MVLKCVVRAIEWRGALCLVSVRDKSVFFRSVVTWAVGVGLDQSRFGSGAGSASGEGARQQKEHEHALVERIEEFRT